jgi:hypothetical protein
MPQCVKVLPAGQFVVHSGTGTYLHSPHDLVIVDGACTAGLRIYTQEEITALVSAGSGTGTNTPDAALMRETFFMSFGLVIGIWFIGKCVGAVLRLIKGEESEFS